MMPAKVSVTPTAEATTKIVAPTLVSFPAVNQSHACFYPSCSTCVSASSVFKGERTGLVSSASSSVSQRSANFNLCGGSRFRGWFRLIMVSILLVFCFLVGHLSCGVKAVVLLASYSYSTCPLARPLQGETRASASRLSRTPCVIPISAFDKGYDTLPHSNAQDVVGIARPMRSSLFRKARVQRTLFPASLQPPSKPPPSYSSLQPPAPPNSQTPLLGPTAVQARLQPSPGQSNSVAAEPLVSPVSPPTSYDPPPPSDAVEILVVTVARDVLLDNTKRVVVPALVAGGGPGAVPQMPTVGDLKAAIRTSLPGHPPALLQRLFVGGRVELAPDTALLSSFLPFQPVKPPRTIVGQDCAAIETSKAAVAGKLAGTASAPSLHASNKLRSAHAAPLFVPTSASHQLASGPTSPKSEHTVAHSADCSPPRVCVRWTCRVPVTLDLPSPPVPLGQTTLVGASSTEADGSVADRVAGTIVEASTPIFPPSSVEEPAAIIWSLAIHEAARENVLNAAARLRRLAAETRGKTPLSQDIGDPQLRLRHPTKPSWDGNAMRSHAALQETQTRNQTGHKPLNELIETHKQNQRIEPAVPPNYKRSKEHAEEGLQMLLYGTAEPMALTNKLTKDAKKLVRILKPFTDLIDRSHAQKLPVSDTAVLDTTGKRPAVEMEEGDAFVEPPAPASTFANRLRQFCRVQADIDWRLTSRAALLCAFLHLQTSPSAGLRSGSGAKADLDVSQDARGPSNRQSNTTSSNRFRGCVDALKQRVFLWAIPTILLAQLRPARVAGKIIWHSIPKTSAWKGNQTKN
eukprot:GHVT01082514.1.p1 GENE.GHVT01082514.1~~GHVT01082514.1.p1  ORF type:complete len:802 (-),score=91.31 GHVT01082514.1:904-3309(-)